MRYIDTSVIIAALDSLDPRQRIAREVLESEEPKVISELVLMELASVISRRDEVLSSIANMLGLSKELSIAALLLYILKRFKLQYKSINGYVKIPLLNKVHKLAINTIQLSPILKLKTLDLLHIAYIKLMKEKGVAVRTLITVDEDFKKREEVVKRTIDIDIQLIK
ncbi:MAG: PIN domain nuclease [Thermoprotei archaeon]|nr:MAG: PIN domain nuclease [Thermoprotei archaeon]